MDFSTFYDKRMDIQILTLYCRFDNSDTTEFAKSGSRVALIALEMLLPIMEDDLLKLPSLCRK